MLDLLLKNGTTITGSPIEIGIKNGKIVTLKEKIVEEAQKEIDLDNEQYVSAGWIDDHVHCYEKMNLYYDFPDEIGVKKGVTTIIDAGTTGAENIGDFFKLAEQAKTNVYALLNISKWGIVEQDELADLSKIQEMQIWNALRKYRNFIVGIKARMSKTVIGVNGIIPLTLAKKIQLENEFLPLMIHVGSAPPELQEILGIMDKGDILTHCFNGKQNGILNQDTGKIKDFVWDAYKKGIIFDVGHGTDSFNFHVAETALREGMKASSISTDIYVCNRINGPVYDLATTMEKMNFVGYSWKEIIKRVTEVPAYTFNLKSKGQLKIGYDADLTIFNFINSEKELIDSNDNVRLTSQQICPIKTIIGGIVYDN